jgi:hypothetical protein
MYSPECHTPTVVLVSLDTYEAVWVVDCAISASLHGRNNAWTAA